MRILKTPTRSLHQLAEVHPVLRGEEEQDLLLVQEVVGAHQLHVQAVGGDLARGRPRRRFASRCAQAWQRSTSSRLALRTMAAALLAAGAPPRLAEDLAQLVAVAGRHDDQVPAGPGPFREPPRRTPWRWSTGSSPAERGRLGFPGWTPPARLRGLLRCRRLRRSRSSAGEPPAACRVSSGSPLGYPCRLLDALTRRGPPAGR